MHSKPSAHGGCGALRGSLGKAFVIQGGKTALGGPVPLLTALQTNRPCTLDRAQKGRAMCSKDMPLAHLASHSKFSLVLHLPVGRASGNHSFSCPVLPLSFES